MKKCNLKQISLYLDGKLSAEEQEKFLAHIRQCPRCNEELQSIKALKASFSSAAQVKESSDFDFRFNRLLDERLEKKRKKLFNWEHILYPVPAAIRVAASFIVVIGIVSGARFAVVQKAPFVEFGAGRAKIYEGNAWLMAEQGRRLKTNDKIMTQSGAVLNIASKGRYKARIKDNSLIVISKLENGIFGSNMDLNISYGKFLVNTTEGFKKSSITIHTPACDAEVVGTAFMVDVYEDRTWIGVLKGKVRVTSKVHPLKQGEVMQVSTYISSGQKINIEPYKYSTIPELFSEYEWQEMQELYQLVQKPRIMLILGTGPNRVNELLKPAPVYIPASLKNTVPAPVHKAINAVLEAEKREDMAGIKNSTQNLEILLNKYSDSAYNVEMLMFVASHYNYTARYEDALRVFEEVITRFPDSPYASLAQCSIATIYKDYLKDAPKARAEYNKLLRLYPNSIDAAGVSEALVSLQ